MICYIVPISEKGNAISTLYLFWRKAYQSYIVLENEGGRPQKDMEQLYHSSISGYITFAKSTITVLYLDISLLQKALPQCYILPDIDISRYGTRLIFLLMVFCCRRISQTCHFLPQEKFPVKPSAFESEIHPSHKSKICTLCISPCREQIHASVNNKC